MELKENKSLQHGKYRIISSIGQGGFGITYLAEEVATKRHVAIKEFFMKEHCNRDASSRVSVGSEGSEELVSRYKEKFIKEARTIASLNNPHIVRILDIFEENGTAYYVMEFHSGGSLMDKVKDSGPMSEVVALQYIKQVADALSYIHGRNILHLDIKPANILLDDQGGVVLIDFGVSKHYDESGSQTSTTPLGISKGFAPMEQYQQGNVSVFTPATDIYSLGATLYYLLTGTVPPDATEIYENGIPPFDNKISQRTRAAIVKAMSPRRKDRPQSIEEFLRLLNGEATPATADESTVVMGVSENKSEVIAQKLPNEKTPSSQKNRSTKVAILLIVVLVLIIGIGIKNSQRDSVASTTTTSSQDKKAVEDKLSNLVYKAYELASKKGDRAAVLKYCTKDIISVADDFGPNDDIIRYSISKVYPYPNAFDTFEAGTYGLERIRFGAESITVTKLESNSATVDLVHTTTYRELDEGTGDMVLQSPDYVKERVKLIIENGEWKISDIISKGEHMKERIRRHSYVP
jgi:serine/threonine protein kinase